MLSLRHLAATSCPSLDPCTRREGAQIISKTRVKQGQASTMLLSCERVNMQVRHEIGQILMLSPVNKFVLGNVAHKGCRDNFPDRKAAT